MNKLVRVLGKYYSPLILLLDKRWRALPRGGYARLLGVVRLFLMFLYGLWLLDPLMGLGWLFLVDLLEDLI